jgi:tetratricopeptide (TPR) repeat protein
MNNLTRKALIFALAMAVVAAAGWFGRKTYKRYTEKRLLAQANQYFEKQDLRDASLCLQRTLQINPISVGASEQMARMMETVGAPSALSWRIRTAQLDPHEMEHRLAWAETALKVGDVKSTEEALGGVDEKTKATAVYYKLRGALAWAKGSGSEAEKEYNEALRLEPANQAVLLNLATIHLASTNADVAQRGRMSTNATLRMTVLRQLVTYAEARKDLPMAAGYARQILNDKQAVFSDKLSYLTLLRAQNSRDFPPYLSTLKEEAGQSSPQTFGLGEWLMRAEGPTNTLTWLRSLPMTIQTNQPVPMLISDCLLAQKDWNGILALIDKQDWGEMQWYRYALEALAYRSLDESAASTGAWQKAVRLVGTRLDHLAKLSQVAGAWGWDSEQVKLLETITVQFPKEKWAVQALMTQYYKGGNTKQISALITKLAAADPANNQLKNNLAVISLLQKSDLDKAYKLAKEAYDTTPDNPFFATTYAYSLLLQNKKQEAMTVVEKVKPEFLKNPSVAAYYGVVEAQCGNKNAARAPLERADAAMLLPEEKELVHNALAQL